MPVEIDGLDGLLPLFGAGAVILRAFGETFVTLFVITDPIGNAPIFVAITRNLTPKERQRAALRAVSRPAR